MRAKHLMIAGAATGIAFMVIGVIVPANEVLVVMFGAGMLFGKGYGIWEERQRRGPKP